VPVDLLLFQKMPGSPGLMPPACMGDDKEFYHEGFLVADLW
jgi:hypothetical protein